MTLKVADNDELVGWISLVAGQGRKIRQLKSEGLAGSEKDICFKSLK
jgi:hypothetical protein